MGRKISRLPFNGKYIIKWMLNVSADGLYKIPGTRRADIVPRNILDYHGLVESLFGWLLQQKNQQT